MSDSTHRLLDEEEIVALGDEFKFHSLSPEFWAPCDSFVGWKVRDLIRGVRIQIRRLKKTLEKDEKPKSACLPS